MSYIMTKKTRYYYWWPKGHIVKVVTKKHTSNKDWLLSVIMVQYISQYISLCCVSDTCINIYPRKCFSWYLLMLLLLLISYFEFEATFALGLLTYIPRIIKRNIYIYTTTPSIILSLLVFWPYITDHFITKFSSLKSVLKSDNA